MEFHTYCQQQRYSVRSVVSGDIRLVPTFVGVRWWGGVKWECGHHKCKLSLSIAIYSVWNSQLALNIEIYTASRGFPATFMALVVIISITVMKIIWNIRTVGCSVHDRELVYHILYSIYYSSRDTVLTWRRGVYDIGVKSTLHWRPTDRRPSGTDLKFGKISNGDNSATGHPILFGSRVGFSMWMDRMALFRVRLHTIGMWEKTMRDE